MKGGWQPSINLERKMNGKCQIKLEKVKDDTAGKLKSSTYSKYPNFWKEAPARARLRKLQNLLRTYNFQKNYSEEILAKANIVSGKPNFPDFTEDLAQIEYLLAELNDEDGEDKTRSNNMEQVFAAISEPNKGVEEDGSKQPNVVMTSELTSNSNEENNQVDVTPTVSVTLPETYNEFETLLTDIQEFITSTPSVDVVAATKVFQPAKTSLAKGNITPSTPEHFNNLIAFLETTSNFAQYYSDILARREEAERVSIKNALKNLENLEAELTQFIRSNFGSEEALQAVSLIERKSALIDEDVYTLEQLNAVAAQLSDFITKQTKNELSANLKTENTDHSATSENAGTIEIQTDKIKMPSSKQVVTAQPGQTPSFTLDLGGVGIKLTGNGIDLETSSSASGTRNSNSDNDKPALPTAPIDTDENNRSTKEQDTPLADTIDYAFETNIAPFPKDEISNHFLRQKIGEKHQDFIDQNLSGSVLPILDELVRLWNGYNLVKNSNYLGPAKDRQEIREREEAEQIFKNWQIGRPTIFDQKYFDFDFSADASVRPTGYLTCLITSHENENGSKSKRCTANLSGSNIERSFTVLVNFDPNFFTPYFKELFDGDVVGFSAEIVRLGVIASDETSRLIKIDDDYIEVRPLSKPELLLEEYAEVVEGERQITKAGGPYFGQDPKAFDLETHIARVEPIYKKLAEAVEFAKACHERRKGYAMIYVSGDQLITVTEQLANVREIVPMLNSTTQAIEQEAREQMSSNLIWAMTGEKYSAQMAENCGLMITATGIYADEIAGEIQTFNAGKTN